jgi:hypothetical protein
VDRFVEVRAAFYWWVSRQRRSVLSRTLSVVLIQLLAAFGDDSLQFVGFLARERTCGAVDDGLAFLIGDPL